jgi:hypothetical protein
MRDHDQNNERSTFHNSCLKSSLSYRERSCSASLLKTDKKFFIAAKRMDANRVAGVFAHQIADLRATARRAREHYEAIRQAESESLDDVLDRFHKAWKKAVEEGRIGAN